MSDAGFISRRAAWLEQVAQDPSLPAASYRVAVLIAGYLNRETGDAWPSIATLCDRLNTDRTTIQRAVRRLETGGHLEVTMGRGRNISSRYRPIMDQRKGGKSAAFSDPEKGGVPAALSEGEKAAKPHQKRRQSCTVKGGSVAALTCEEPIEGTCEEGEGPSGPSPSTPSTEVASSVEGSKEITRQPRLREPAQGGRSRRREVTEKELAITFDRLCELEPSRVVQEAEALARLRRLLETRQPSTVIAAFDRQKAGTDVLPFGHSLEQWLAMEAA